MHGQDELKSGVYWINGKKGERRKTESDGGKEGDMG